MNGGYVRYMKKYKKIIFIFLILVIVITLFLFRTVIYNKIMSDKATKQLAEELGIADINGNNAVLKVDYLIVINYPWTKGTRGEQLSFFVNEGKVAYLKLKETILFAIDSPYYTYQNISQFTSEDLNFLENFMKKNNKYKNKEGSTRNGDIGFQVKKNNEVFSMMIPSSETKELFEFLKKFQ